MTRKNTMNIAKYWRQNGSRYRLEAQRARDGRVRFPAQPPRPGEGVADWEDCRLSGQGEIWSWTVQSANAEGFEAEPAVIVGLIKTVEGPLLTAQLTDCAPEDLAIGLPVEMVAPHRHARAGRPAGLRLQVPAQAPIRLRDKG
jgi:uncharacterized OB-fold protein